MLLNATDSCSVVVNEVHMWACDDDKS